MTKFFFTILSAILFVPAVAAQSVQPTPPKLKENPPGEPCRIKLKDSPTVRGIRLDMPKAEVQKEYPLMIITPDPVKSSGIALGYQISNPDYQENIDRLTVIFRNNRVFSVLITYSDLISWDSAEEFADKISKSLGLPKAVPRNRAGGVYYSVNCGEFAVRTRITTDKYPTLYLTKDPDEIWETTQQKKDAFKP
jgi:hypothetical protein